MKRLIKQVNTGVQSVGSMLIDRIQPTLTEAAFKAGELLGLARCHRWLQPLGLPVSPICCNAFMHVQRRLLRLRQAAFVRVLPARADFEMHATPWLSGTVSQLFERSMQGGDVKQAVDCCVLLNEWDQAVTLAEQQNFPQIEGLLTKYAGHLLEKQRHMEAVQLYQKVSNAAVGCRALHHAVLLLCGSRQACSDIHIMGRQCH